MKTPRLRQILPLALFLPIAYFILTSPKLSRRPALAATPADDPAAETSDANTSAAAGTASNAPLPATPAPGAELALTTPASGKAITPTETTPETNPPEPTDPTPSAPPEPAPIPTVPADTESFRVAVRFFTLDLKDGNARFASLANNGPGKGSILSPEEGWEAFHTSQKGLDILSAPAVQTRPGEHARIEVVRELIYPTAMENDSATGEMVPSDFDTINTGVMLDLEVRPTSDPTVLDVYLNPMIRVFQNFVPSEDNPDLNVPVFQEAGAPYRGPLRNGSYLILGTRTDIETIVNSIPFLGDLPIIGSFFRSEETIEYDELVAIQPIITPN